MKYIYYIGGYKYQLARDYIIQTSIKGFSCDVEGFIRLWPDGMLTIYKGYAWDGASGPGIDTKTIMRGSLVHDVLYQLLREGLLPRNKRMLADIELKRICLEDGMWKVRAWWVSWGVRRCAGYAAAPRNKKEEQRAP